MPLNLTLTRKPVKQSAYDSQAETLKTEGRSAFAGRRERVKAAAAEELERLGIADETGKRMRTEVPQDMKDGADRDFGG